MDLSTEALAESPTMSHRAGERQADHERGGRGGGAARVAQRVLPGQVADRAEERGVRRPRAACRNGRLITGLAAATPSRIASAPRRRRPGARAPRATARTPATPARRATSRAPISSRRRIDDSGSAMSSRSAWTGAILAVRRAGSAAAAIGDHHAHDVATRGRCAARRPGAARTGRARTARTGAAGASRAGRRARGRSVDAEQAERRTPRAAPTRSPGGGRPRARAAARARGCAARPGSRTC